MIRTQRNMHRKIWMSMAVLLPIGIIFSWLVVSNRLPAKSLSVTHTNPLPEIRGKWETSQYCIRIRSDAGRSAWQLEWKNKYALTVPSAVIYQAVGNNSNIDSARLVGRIEARGDYLFPLASQSNNAVHLLLYDFIHEKIIDSINIKIL